MAPTPEQRQAAIDRMRAAGATRFVAEHAIDALIAHGWGPLPKLVDMGPSPVGRMYVIEDGEQ